MKLQFSENQEKLEKNPSHEIRKSEKLLQEKA